MTTNIENVSRIAAIVKLIPEREIVWDVCCDHGLIGIKALTEKGAVRVKFVDIADHLIANVRKKFEGRSLSPFSESVDFISSDASALASQFSGTVVIAGVGARLIREILKSYSLSSNRSVYRFILCPHKGNAEQLNWSSVLPGISYSEETLEINERGRSRTIFLLNMNPNLLTKS